MLKNKQESTCCVVNIRGLLKFLYVIISLPFFRNFLMRQKQEQQAKVNVLDWCSTLGPSYFLETRVPSKKKEPVMYMYVRNIYVASFYDISIAFGTVSTVWYFRTVPTVGYFRTVPKVWYFRTVPTVWYVFLFIVSSI